MTRAAFCILLSLLAVLITPSDLLFLSVLRSPRIYDTLAKRPRQICEQHVRQCNEHVRQRTNICGHLLTANLQSCTTNPRKPNTREKNPSESSGVVSDRHGEDAAAGPPAHLPRHSRGNCAHLSVRDQFIFYFLFFAEYFVSLASLPPHLPQRVLDLTFLFLDATQCPLFSVFFFPYSICINVPPKPIPRLFFCARAKTSKNRTVFETPGFPIGGVAPEGEEKLRALFL